MTYLRQRMMTVVIAALAAGLAGACDALLTAAPDPADILDGPIDGLTAAEAAAFAAGDERFEERFTVRTGLGPIFNNVSCAGCHSGDGRGRPEPGFSNIVLRIDPSTGSHGSPTIERRAIPGAEAEPDPVGVPVSVRLPPPVFGLGFIEAIPASEILRREDADDRDGDGVSGRAHRVTAAPWVPLTEPGGGPGPQLGRFTRRARTSTIFEQVVDAYHKDMGITTDFLPFENPNLAASTPTVSFDGVDDPEIPVSVVQQVVFYLRTLAPPAPGAMTEARQRGEQVFSEIGCAACHTPVMRTGPHAVAALSNRDVRLYSDLLLHDMGDALADGVADKDASGREWRTAPLWGLRVMRDFLGGDAFLMHDGRARSVEEAISLHGGEAAGARGRWQQLSAADRAALLDFVESR
ncbi:MAG: thiol oxidoreductase [Gemmatimonadetes bacterium]|nr:thiol oxidoreductase [Gemmatimonadota bacterium]